MWHNAEASPRKRKTEQNMLFRAESFWMYTTESRLAKGPLWVSRFPAYAQPSVPDQGSGTARREADTPAPDAGAGAGKLQLR